MNLLTIIECLLSVVSAVVGWLVGRHVRRKSAINVLVSTINDLSNQLNEYQSKIIDLQNEIIEVRRENAELKLGQKKMTAEIKRLQEENGILKKLIIQKSK